jgi:hypothetical protein
MKRWTKEEEQKLKELFKNNNYSYLSKIFNRTEGAIRAKCFDMNLIKKDKWTENDIKFLKENYHVLTVKEIAKKLNRTETAISVKAKKIGLKRYEYYCNYSFFENIDTEEKAYWLGFIYADGWTEYHKNTNSGYLGIELKRSDVNHLKKFNKSLSGNYPIKEHKRKDIEIPNYFIRINSVKMYNDLIKLGVVPNKTYSLKFPIIPNHLIKHFIRGFFDGDGCVRIRHRETKKNGIVSYPICDIVCYVEDFLLSIREILFEKKIYSYIYYDNNIPRLYINSMESNIKFLKYIYQDANIYLDRKYKRYLQSLKLCNTQDCLAN